MAKETQFKKDSIDCINNTQPSQDTTIPLTPPSTNPFKTETSRNNEIKDINKDNNPLQDEAYHLLLDNVIKIQNDSSTESSEEEEYETPSKEPYEDKYIKFTTIDALDFLPASNESDAISFGGVMNIIHKASYLTFVLCLVTSILAAFSSQSIRSFLFLDLSTFYILCACCWIYCLYELNSFSLSLKETINAAKKISMSITVFQSIYQFSMYITNNVEANLSSSNFLLSAGSVISFPFFILLEELLIAYQKENYNKQALLNEERKKSQLSVYKAIEHFSERKGLYLRTISDQLRQTTTMAMDTLKQLSPPNFLSKPNEQLSACSISFPTASINAIYNTLKDVNYISTHLGTLSLLLFSEQGNQETSLIKREFDIGEVIQHVGDVLAGDACKAKVELVIYHVEYVDYGLNHLNVIGDEAAFRHSLLDLLKCMIDCASPGDCVELGLQIRLSNESESHGKERTIKQHDKVTCTIEIMHTAGVSGYKASKHNNIFPNANLTFKILNFLGAKLKVEDGLEITIEFEAGSPLTSSNVPNVIKESRRRYPHLRMTGEPSIEELKKTSQNMREQKVALHATSKSCFAKHITSCLTTWNTDISHVPIGGEDEFDSEAVPPSVHEALPDDSDVSSEKHKSHDEHANILPTFIIIDDDINTLKQQLTQLKKVPFKLNPMSVRSKRQGQMPNLPSQTIAVIHFTSIANYKSVKDAVQCIISPETGSFSPPQVLVIPKPAGPRRFLTALHTTINKIVVDPVYMPIATSPMSPGRQLINGGVNNDIEQDKSPLVNGHTESSGTYFPPYRPGSPSTPAGKSSNSPMSPKGTGGGILIVPKGNLPSRNSEGQNKMRIANPLPPTKGIGTPTSPGINIDSNQPKPVPSPSVQTPSMQNQPSTQQPRIKSSNKSRSKGKSNTDTVIPPVNVLIVEDNPINQAILSTFMKKKKIKYECASNGQEAVDKWQKGGFHLVLMDIQLPVMDGIEATKKIRSLEKSQKIGVFPSTPSSSASSSVSSTPISTPMKQSPPTTPDLGLIPVIIVALTASSLSSDRTNALAAGCNDFLTKPVSLVWLEKKIQEWGCMQALIDFDGWRRWKRDGEEAKKEKKIEPVTNSICLDDSGESSVKLSKNLKHKQNSQAEYNNNSTSEKNETEYSIKTAISRSTSSNDSESSSNSSDKKESTTSNESTKDSPAGMVSSAPPIITNPSIPLFNKESITEANSESYLKYSISTTNNIKNNSISNNPLTIITNSPIPSTNIVTNESSSQPSTPLSTSAPQRKRGNTFSSITGVIANVCDQNGNGHI